LAFEIIELHDEAPAITTARVAVRYDRDDEEFEKELDLRLLCLDEEGAPIVRGTDRGSWTVLNLWTLT
jgi:hypothetical protein